MNRVTTKKLFPLMLAALPVFLAACPVPVDFWDSRTVHVDIPASDPPSVNSTQTVNLSDDSAISKNLDKLANMSVENVWVEIENIQPGNLATTASGTLTITDPSDPTWGPITVSYPSVPIVANGTVQVPLTSSELKAMASLLQSKHKIAVQYQASVDQLPALFDLEGKLHISVSVNVNT